jgi:hypothetical protein
MPAPMSSLPAADLRGVLALVALLTLPGVLVVRAPWTTVPALSVAFWTLSWWWLPIEGRGRLLVVLLASSGVLALLRLLPKRFVPPPAGHPAPPPPVSGPTSGTPPRLLSLPSALVVALALGLVSPFILWAHAPGPEMAFATTSARLAVWRDALPWSYAPLLPLAPFGAAAPAPATLAADLSLLSGLDPARTVVLATLAALGLGVLGLYAFLATRVPAGAAALVATLALAAVPWPGVLAVWGEEGAILALPLLLAAAALLTGHTSRPSAVAAGILLAAATLAQPLMSLGMVAALAVAGGQRELPRRALAGGVAVALALPGLLRTAGALSGREALLVLETVRPGEVGTFVEGVALATLLALLVGGRRGRRLPLAVVATLSVFAGVVLVLRVHGWLAGGQLPLPVRSALARVSRRTTPLEAVCASADVVDWVPALAGRPVGASGPRAAGPWVPPVFRDEAERGPRLPCALSVDAPPASTGPGQSHRLTAGRGTGGERLRSTP